jgi:hypothetical protein
MTITKQVGDKIVPLSEEELAELEKRRQEWYVIERDGTTVQNRQKRDEIIAGTDHWAFTDTPDMTPEQIAYRQALRDITSHANWPYLEEADWPTKP